MRFSLLVGKNPQARRTHPLLQRGILQVQGSGGNGRGIVVREARSQKHTYLNVEIALKDFPRPYRLEEGTRVCADGLSRICVISENRDFRTNLPIAAGCFL